MAKNDDKDVGELTAHDKIARLLALLVTQNMEQKTEKVVLLRRIGFSIGEVAAVLGMTTNHVKVASHFRRKKSAKRPNRRD